MRLLYNCCVTAVYLLCACYAPAVYLLCACCMTAVCLLCTYCAPAVYLLCAYCAPAMCLLYTCCITAVLLLWGPDTKQVHSRSTPCTVWAGGRQAWEEPEFRAQAAGCAVAGMLSPSGEGPAARPQ